MKLSPTVALLFLAVPLMAAPTPPEGVLPVGGDGKPLNLDFETGMLKDWTAEGDAFEGQPIEGDSVSKRRADMKSGHQGKFWIGGYEKHGDKSKGTLTSVPFTVTHPWASFLIGGGAGKETFVEVVDAEAKTALITAHGDDDEAMKRVAFDLSKHQGKKVFVRIVDHATGGWGHVNFDDFRFHTEKPAVAEKAKPLSADEYKYAGQKPEDAAKNMTVPKGFNVTLFAGEPDLHQPIAFCFDDRGRLWVVEAYCYPKRHPEKGPIIPHLPGEREGDKILIFEDTDGDGKFDKKTVFMKGLNLVSGIEYGFGELWIGAAPYFLFIPILEGDKPGEPKILLDGWGYQDTHETLNSFIWGPDGWLYGCHGVFTYSHVGKPGTPEKERTYIDAGVWRYHPTRHTFEVFAEGTSNPWGLDYNRHGDFFAEACVIPHLWHIVQGGRYQRQAGPHVNPYTYDDIKTIAKHRHFLGATPHGGNGKSDSAGGGHAHSGLLCYQGGAWPKEYDGKLLMGNIHGHRINVDEVKPKGSSYEGDRNPDFLLSHDKHCIIVAIHAGPDGNVYFCDWSDKQVCHLNNPQVWDRTNGRLFKISYEGTKPVKNLDLQKLSDEELVKLQASDNEWMVRHSRRILQERYGKEPKPNLEVFQSLEALLAHDDPAKRLHALWALHCVGRFQVNGLQPSLSNDTSEYIQAWMTQIEFESLSGERGSNSKVGIKAPSVEEVKQSPVIRRALASGLLRLPPSVRVETLKVLVQHVEDAKDDVLPDLYWYALEPLCAENPKLALQIAAEGKIPQLLTFASRRIGSLNTPAASEVLITGLSKSKATEHQLALLGGLQESITGKRKADAPKGWTELYPTLAKSDSFAVREAALALAVKFGDPAAAAALLAIVGDAAYAATARQSALESLIDVGHNRLGGVLKDLLKDPAMRTVAIRGMARVADDGVPEVLITGYALFNVTDRREAIATLASRVAYAKELLAALERKAIPSTDIPAELVRQLRNLGDANINEKLATVWGTVRDTPADRKKLIADWTRKLATPANAPVDLPHGRAVFAKVCAQCHTLYGVGGKVGPEITGSNRADLGYLLENIFDPSAVIPKEYAATKLDLLDGRVVTGIVKGETPAALTIMTDRETLTIPVTDIDKRTPSAESMMPNDLTKTLSEADVRALVAYLRHPRQVPMKATADNAKDFFNGKDLNGWVGDKDVWSVDGGEIVGKTATGLKKNTFLKSDFDAGDFKLALKVKLVPDAGNSGVQFRSVPLDDGEMRGPQADIGKGWWGKLYEESGRGLLVKEGGEKHVKPGEWNDYEVEAIGPRVRIRINGELVCDTTDDKLATRGQIAFQVHSGGPMEVRFKDLKFEPLGK